MAFWALLCVSVSAAVAQTANDEVLLLQHSVNSEAAAAHSLAGLFGGMELRDELARPGAHLVSKKTVLMEGSSEMEQNRCTAEERSKVNRTVMKLMRSRQPPRLPKECPQTMTEAFHAKPGPCLRKLLNVSKECTECHTTLVKSLPGAVPGCLGIAFECPTNPNEQLSQGCFSKLSSCLQRVAPYFVSNIQCTGGYPKEAPQMINDAVASFAQGKLMQTGSMMNLVKTTSALFR
eukprot:CAMPEP_0171097142 /NCGR_PEP_ID=MMETSP0766_2-20121228/47064_1 /TAXON_ID=439317 /ORGANISM="Gambierdiscus australes, Strain CAWD 149" /LENGTH=233 /DNA_ID=CAMNT_0011556287 /DNA_START=35 /DNA_END=736 /DNA_ORIENTATION=+